MEVYGRCLAITSRGQMPPKSKAAEILHKIRTYFGENMQNLSSVTPIPITWLRPDLHMEYALSSHCSMTRYKRIAMMLKSCLVMMQ